MFKKIHNNKLIKKNKDWTFRTGLYLFIYQALVLCTMSLYSKIVSLINKAKQKSVRDLRFHLQVFF